MPKVTPKTAQSIVPQCLQRFFMLPQKLPQNAESRYPFD
nr:MAG TPA: hypothetical protein [Caudoviricetes sp.]